MEFDLKAFENASLKARTESVPVPGLAVWFNLSKEHISELDAITSAAERDKFAIEHDIVWQVRGLSDDELESASKDAAGSRGRLAEVFTEMLDMKSGEADDIKEKLGVNEGVNMQTALRAEHLYRGSVNPKIPIHAAHKLGRAYPIEFRVLTTKILELTGLGAIDEKKSKPSGEAKKSK